jgi:acetyl esterase/lipase
MAIGGCSGGGYTAMVAAILLARESQTSLVKQMILVSPMLGRNLEDEPDNIVPDWEKTYVNSLPFDLLVDNFETMNANRDPILYPFNISLEEAKLLPKTTLFTSEFCWLRRDTHWILPKLKKAGVY